LNTAKEKAAGMLDTSEAALEKRLATLIAQFALAGHVVHKGCDSDFTVCKYAMVKYCKDLAELQAFARQVGVTL
jgi:hypothetical protein